jgi:NADPH-dependent curcumin reductase CurA
MENMKNKQILLASRPAGMPTPDNFKLVETAMPQPVEGEVLIRTLYLSVDPYMRGRMSDRKSYVAPFALNEVITGGVIGEVIESRAENFQPGDIVTGHLGWQLYSAASGDYASPTSVRKVDPRIAPVTTALGVLGMPGLTAYFGLLDIGQPMSGETVVVSGAAGAVGTAVCQLAKIKGCRVVGIAGSDAKNDYLRDELGVDATINYKTAGEMREALKEACPNGVDIYFDNVGGEISDDVMMQIKHKARIIICGQISIYNLEQMDVGPRIQPFLLVNSALMQGFIITDYEARFAEGITQMAQWLAEGKLKYAEHVVEEFENTPQAFLGLFTGDNLGKQLVKV